MIVEEIISKIYSEFDNVQESFKNIQALCKELESGGDEQYDWVSVKKASSMLDVSMPMIYERVSDGRISSKRFGSKLFVRLSELKAVNDKVQ